MWLQQSYGSLKRDQLLSLRDNLLYETMPTDVNKKFWKLKVKNRSGCMLTVNVSETVAQRCSIKKVLLKISQNSQKSTCIVVSSFIKLHAWPEACNFIKKETPTQIFFHELCEVFKVARVINLKQDFTEWFFNNLVIIIKLYKIRYLSLNKALLFQSTRLLV